MRDEVSALFRELCVGLLIALTGLRPLQAGVIIPGSRSYDQLLS